MGLYKDFTGKTFSDVLMISYSHSCKKGDAFWLCQCHCGKQFITKGTQVARGKTRSCGCLRKLSCSRHGDYKTDFYHCWLSMKQRCENPKLKNYKDYGGRGITYCDRWKDYLLFKEDMFSSYQKGLSIDRIDVNGNYEPSNCKWSTYTQQNRNTRYNKRYDTPFGQLTLGEISEICGIKIKTLDMRRVKKLNISYEELTAPLHQGNHKR